jgi:hypothetical protein
MTNPVECVKEPPPLVNRERRQTPTTARAASVHDGSNVGADFI